jgi:hypothetical protein
MRSIHDNRVIGYTVDHEQRMLILRTEFEGREHTDVVFDGVLAYFLENDNFSNVLFSIAEVPLTQLLHEQRELFENGTRFAWPGPWNTSSQAASDYLGKHSGRAFVISSSFGLCGWVIAKECRFDPNGAV